MHQLLALVAASVVCALARPPDYPRNGPMFGSFISLAEFQRERARLLGNDWRTEDDPTIGHLPRLPLPRPIDWLSEEIARLSLKEYDEYERERDPPVQNQKMPYASSSFNQESAPMPEYEYRQDSNTKLISEKPRYIPKPDHENQDIPSEDRNTANTIVEEKRKAFAFTPLDKEYFEKDVLSRITAPKKLSTMAPFENNLADMLFEEPRKTRQNPNLSKTKTLIAENLDKLRTGTMTVEEGPSDIPRHQLVDPLAQDPADSIYGVALMAAVGAALSIAIIGFGFGWYTLSKRAKAAADVDYPAYGVTGPNVDASGDRKLAHSAHMYHYQHQKQQIIAMERNGLDQRNGSISDPDSEEENEEGDYTVYEWPGFATTGEMEVKNPLYSDDPTPATPCKVELVKPQPK